MPTKILYFLSETNSCIYSLHIIPKNRRETTNKFSWCSLNLYEWLSKAFKVKFKFLLHSMTYKSPWNLACLCNFLSCHSPIPPSMDTNNSLEPAKISDNVAPPLVWNLKTQNPRWRQGKSPRKNQPSQQKQVLRMKREGEWRRCQWMPNPVCFPLFASSIPRLTCLLLPFKITFAGLPKEKTKIPKADLTLRQNFLDCTSHN